MLALGWDCVHLAGSGTPKPMCWDSGPGKLVVRSALSSCALSRLSVRNILRSG